MKHGKGKFVLNDGSVYEGSLKENMLDGFGVYKWPDGRTYEGQWKANKMHGKGVYKWNQTEGMQYDG